MSSTGWYRIKSYASYLPLASMLLVSPTNLGTLLQGVIHSLSLVYTLPLSHIYTPFLLYTHSLSLVRSLVRACLPTSQSLLRDSKKGAEILRRESSQASPEASPVGKAFPSEPGLPTEGFHLSLTIFSFSLYFFSLPSCVYCAQDSRIDQLRVCVV